MTAQVPQDPSPVDAYLEALPAERRQALETIRTLMREAAPDARETMHYGMPTYDLAGMLFAFASQKRYMSLYVIETDVVDRLPRGAPRPQPGQGMHSFPSDRGAAP